MSRLFQPLARDGGKWTCRGTEIGEWHRRFLDAPKDRPFGDLEPREAIAILLAESLADPPGPPLLQAPPTRPERSRLISATSLRSILPGVPRPLLLSCEAGLAQSLDFWDQGHEAAQQADDRGEGTYAPYWHGIAHRREPDRFNAGYWFRRVGRHPLFPALLEASRPIFAAHGARPPGGAWDPIAFIDLCLEGNGGGKTASLALDLQRLEMTLLMEATLDAAIGESR